MSTEPHIEKSETKFNLLPYGGHVGAPSISPTDVSVFLQTSTNKFNHYVDQKYVELKQEMEKLVSLYRLNEIIYASEMRFEPVMGFTYHLYERKDYTRFLSMISPDEWNMTYICTVTLNTDGQWVLQKGTIPQN